MTPERLEALATVADPGHLWRLSPLDRDKLPLLMIDQIDIGVALRRYAAHMRDLERALAEGKSLLITPLTPASSARRLAETPPEHQRLVDVTPAR